MNNEFKKGFLEAIDGVLDIINDAEKELDKDSKSFKYELKKLENSVLGLKVAFFDTYYENPDESDEHLLRESPPLLMTKEEFLKSQEADFLRERLKKRSREDDDSGLDSGITIPEEELIPQRWD